MAVPITGASLLDVISEVSGSQSSLLDCITDADPSAYDPAYYSSPATSLLEFRNYEESTDTVSTDISTINFGTGTPSQTVQVFSNASWTVSDNMTWVTVTPTSGSNDGSILVAVNSSNVSGFPRSGIVTITTSGGETATITVNQVA